MDSRTSSKQQTPGIANFSTEYFILNMVFTDECGKKSYTTHMMGPKHSVSPFTAPMATRLEKTITCTYLAKARGLSPHTGGQTWQNIYIEAFSVFMSLCNSSGVIS